MTDPKSRVESVPFSGLGADDSPQSNALAEEFAGEFAAESADETAYETEEPGIEPRRVYYDIEGQGELFTSRGEIAQKLADASEPADVSTEDEPESDTVQPVANPAADGTDSPAVESPAVERTVVINPSSRGSGPAYGGGSNRKAKKRPPRSWLPSSSDFFQNSTVAGRLMALASIAVVGIVLVGLVAIWGVARTTDYNRTQSDLYDVLLETSEISSQISDMSEAEKVESTDIETVRSLIQNTFGYSPSAAIAARRAAASEAWSSYLDAREQGLSPDESNAYLDRVSSAESSLVSATVNRQSQLVSLSETVRTRVVLVVLIGIGLLVVLLGLTTRAIADSIVKPLKRIGRVIRRFGDGDHGIRADEAYDEIGLLGRSFNQMASSVGGRLGDLSAESQRSSQLRMISETLDLADSELDIHRIVERSLGILIPGTPAELLLVNPRSNLLGVVASNPSVPPPNCTVSEIGDCPAMRGTRTVTFINSKAINSCDSLHDRETPCSAVCIPVSANGIMLGILHITGPDGHPPVPETVAQLEGLCAQIGARISAMRTLESTRIEASTDGLTGLANRRMLEAKMVELLRTRTKFVVAVADLDRFKDLNDTYGHEVGDKALQLFASVLEENVRDHDIVARYGGEEFVLVYPEMSVKTSIEVIDRIRAAMEDSIQRANLPKFTVSMGVTHSSVADSVDALIRIADAGLLVAKDMGRNRVVFADQELAAEVFGSANSPSSRVS